jgi:hypothetical protein
VLGILDAVDAELVLQVINYRRGFEIGSLLLIRQQIITSHSTLNIAEALHGLLKGVPLPNGSRSVRYCGFMGTVRISPTSHRFKLLIGSGHLTL